MRNSVQGREFVSDHVGRPVLRYTHRNEAVQSHRRAEHEVGHLVVIVLIRSDFGGDFDQRLQNTFRPAVHQRRNARDGQVLLHDVYESVCDTAGYLERRQREGGFGIEDRELRERVVARELLLRGEVGDHRPGVHFGAGGRQGHHVAERNDFADFVFIEHQLPGIAVVGNARSDELGTVEYRAAAHREQKIDLFGFALGNGFAQGFDFGIRLDAPELYEVAAFERCDHLVVHAVFLDGAAAESNHDLLVGRNLFRQLGDGAFAEDQLDRILESEVVHTFLVYSVCFPDEVPQGSFCRVESIVSSFIFYAAFSRYRLYPDSFSFCSSYMRSRNLVAARKSNDLAARSISSRARAICVSMLSVE